MSQAGEINAAGGPPPPPVPTSFVTDVNSPSIPIANVENVFGRDVTTNNVQGIQTDGSSGSNTLTVQLTNRFHGFATTTDATPTTIATCPMSANPATFMFRVWVTAFDVTNNASFSTITTLTFRTTGAAPILLVDQDYIIQEEATFSGQLVNLQGSSTQLSVIVTGAASTIKWVCHGEYQQAGP